MKKQFYMLDKELIDALKSDFAIKNSKAVTQKDHIKQISRISLIDVLINSAFVQEVEIPDEMIKSTTDATEEILNTEQEERGTGGGEEGVNNDSNEISSLQSTETDNIPEGESKDSRPDSGGGNMESSSSSGPQQ